jgi:ATP-dependent protease ClpP protease subunit
MPDPAKYDSEEAWMEACMSAAKDEGREHDQAVAMCMSMWRERAALEAKPQAVAEVIDLMSHRGAAAAGYGFKAAARTAEITIYGEIGDELFGGVSAKQIVADLRKAGRIDRIKMRLHSPGGDVFDGLAIYNALMQHEAQVEVAIDGIAASAAALVAMAGAPILAAENSLMMLHRPWHLAIGSADDMRASANVLDRIEATMADIHGRRSGKGIDQARAWLAGTPPARETWFNATEARAAGLIDGLIEQPVKAAASWDVRAWRKRFTAAPERLEELAQPTPAGTPLSAYAARFRDAGMAVQKLRAAKPA